MRVRIEQISPVYLEKACVVSQRLPIRIECAKTFRFR
jgi:hypothetical protein